MSDPTSWKFKLFVNNTTGKKFVVKSKNLFWGHWDLNDTGLEPIEIDAYSNKEVLGIRASKGTWTGYECSCVWVDDSKDSCGSLSLQIDVPFSANNDSSLQYNGLLHVDKWVDLPKRGHTFTQQIDLSLVDSTIRVTGDRMQVDGSDYDDDGYSDYLDQLMNNNDIVNDWSKLQKVDEIEFFDPLAKLPGTYIYPPKMLIGRSPVVVISRKEWAGLGDPIFETLVQKQKYVEDYFAVGVYTVNTDPRAAESIPAGVDTAVETTIEVTSSIKNTLSTHYSIKTSLSAKGTEPTTSIELAATLESEFSIDRVREESSSKLERQTKSIKIAPSDKSRLFVQWLFSEAVAIYRRKKDGSVALIAISEWPNQIVDRTYEY